MFGFSGLAGGPGEAARLTPQGFTIGTSGRGDIPSAKAEVQRRWGFAPGGPVAPSFLPAVGGRRVGWARGLDAPAGLLATAARDRSPRPPGLRRLRRGARLHRILIAPGPCRPPRSLQTRRLFALGHRGWTSAAGRACASGGLVPWSSPPAAGPPQVRTSRDPVNGGNPSPPTPLIARGWVVVGRAGAGGLDYGLWPALLRPRLSFPI